LKEATAQLAIPSAQLIEYCLQLIHSKTQLQYLFSQLAIA
jgi:hypothetical protein